MTPGLEHLNAFIVERMNCGIFVVDADMKVRLWNNFMSNHSGIDAEQALGNDLFDLFPELPGSWLRKKIESVFILRNYAFTSWEQRPYVFRFSHNRPVTGDGESMYQDCTFMPLKGDSGEVEFVCAIVDDVTDVAISQTMRQETLDAMVEMSTRDALTGLYNRRHLEATLEAEFTRARRHEEGLSVLMFDVDHFKQVNDTYGHRAGDAVLCEIASRIRGMLRASDTAGRYGGEEFTLVLPETGIGGAITVAQRLRQAVSEAKIDCRGEALRVTVSLGVSTLRAATPNHERLLDEADTALYQAKRAGRDCVRVFDATSDAGTV
ncbi:MAG: diguanylate cyclase [Ectothiorhodospiraceae bacterium]|jgi:diguanylate cyclase (GGDEF)-like protein/PAS domain S-box-containing protein